MNRSDAELPYKQMMIGVVILTIIYYLIFISRQFMGDDWLWLSNAKNGWSDLSIMLGRPMYGYFRPVNMLYIAIMQKMFGANPYIFSLANIILHALNVYLLFIVLAKLKVRSELALIASFLYAFYYLNAPAIEWISVVHDIWVTAFSLFFVLAVISFTETVSFKRFVLLLVIGLMALGFKESGFVTLGLYFAVLILYGKNPFEKRYLKYSLILIACYAGYLAYYFSEPLSGDDKSVELGIGSVINLWYFLGYMIVPISQRMVEVLPSKVMFLFYIMRYCATIFVPVLIALALVRGGRAIRLFSFWMVGFAATSAIFNWGFGLFDLYPVGRTITRFMYTPNIGMAVLIAWIILWLSDLNFLSFLKKRYMIYSISIVFIIANLAVTYKMSNLYKVREAEVSSIVNDLNGLDDKIEDNSELTLLIGDIENTPQIVYTGKHLEAIINIVYNKNVRINVIDSTEYFGSSAFQDDLYPALYWDSQTSRLLMHYQ